MDVVVVGFWDVGLDVWDGGERGDWISGVLYPSIYYPELKRWIDR